MAKNGLNLLSFFSGAMGLDLGLEKAGFTTRLVCEVDPICGETIRINRSKLPFIGDIRDYTSDQIRNIAGMSAKDEVHLMAGGPPCQAFSTAGKRRAFEDERGNVFLKYIELISELRPLYVVIENVRGLLSAPLSHRPHDQRGVGFPPLSEEEKPGGALLHIIDRLRETGYSFSFNLYNSANFGTPQVRERVIMICSRSHGRVPYLTPTHSQNGEFGLPKWKTFREAVRELPSSPVDYVKFPEKRLRFYRLLKAGQNWRDLPTELQKEAMGKSYYCIGGRTGFFRRISWDKPSPTLVTHPAMPATDLAHPTKDRPLSVQEYRCLQEFPEDWILSGKVLHQYRQLGNAVPCGVGVAIGKHIISHMKGEAIPAFSNFPYSRYKSTDEVSWEKKYRPSIDFIFPL